MQASLAAPPQSLTLILDPADEELCAADEALSSRASDTLRWPFEGTARRTDQ